MSARARWFARAMVVACVVAGAMLASHGCDDVVRENVAPRAFAARTRASAAPTTAIDAARRPILRRGGRASPKADSAPAPFGTVLARVVGADDVAPIAGATVSVPDLEDDGLERRTDVDGVAKFGPLEPERWEFRASAPGRIAEYATCVVAAGAETTLPIRLTASVELNVRVEDRRTGEPIADAKVRRIVVGAAFGLDATTDASGRCRMPSMPDAVVRVTASVEGFDVAESLVRTSSRGTPPTDVVLRLAPIGRMTGVVRATDGTPAARAVVRVTAASDGPVRANGPFVLPRASSSEFDATADGDGRYVVTGLVHGRRYRALALDSRGESGCSSTVERIFTTPDAAEAAQDFVLRPFGGLVVRVTKPDGSGAPSSMPTLTTAFGTSYPNEASGVRADGVFSFNRVPAGEVTFVVVGSDGGAAVRTVVVPSGATTEVGVRLGGSFEVRGVVVDDAGRPVAGAEVSFLRSWAESSFGGSRVDRSVYKCDASGAFRATVGVEGPTDAEVSAPGHLAGPTVRLTAPCDDALIVLRRAATLTFRAVADDASPVRVLPTFLIDGVRIDGVRVSVLGRPDDDGLVRLELEPRGAVQAQIFAFGRAPVVVAARLVAGEVCDLGDVRFVKPRRMSGRVVDAAGRPIAGAFVCVDDHDGRVTSASKKMDRAMETDADGRFSGEWAPPSGVVPLRVDAPGFLELHATPTIAGDAPVVLTLARGGLAWGEVVDAAGAPISDVKVRFVDAAGADAATPTADAHGVFDVRLASGRYVVRADGCDDVAIELREGGDAHVRFVERSR
jgi:hypothetical protein